MSNNRNRKTVSQVIAFLFLAAGLPIASTTASATRYTVKDSGHVSRGEISRAAKPSEATIEPSHMRCESIENPLGVQTMHPRLSWLLDAADKSRRGLRQTAYRILVASSSGSLAKGKGDLWDSDRIESSEFIQIMYGGKALLSHKSYYWQVRVWDQDGAESRWSKPAIWTMGLLHPEDWAAKWIATKADPGSIPAVSPANPDAGRQVPDPLPLFRRDFHVDKPVAKALVYVSGLGHYELHLNGKKVSGDLLTPGWTDYRKTVLYNTYEVTNQLKPGANAIGIMLGNGMYNIPAGTGRYAKFTGSFGITKVILQMRIAFADGTEVSITSDNSWKSSSGPITFSTAYGGEDYDARLEQAGWDTAGYADAGWNAAVEVAGPGGKLSSQLIPPIRAMQEFHSVKITEPKPGIFVYDLGQNFSGWPCLKVSGATGSTIKLTPSELLDGEGHVTQGSSGGPEYFSYTLNGTGVESWCPRFSYYGFRYVQVDGAIPESSTSNGKPIILALSGQFTHLSAETVGQFTNSNVLLNRIHALIDAAILSNMQSVLTDCPHREKLGWLEESYLLGSSIMYNYDVERLYSQIEDDMADAQHASGFVADIAPEYVSFGGGFLDSPEWGSASVLSPWIAYQHYGDRQILSKHYSVMKRYVNYLSSKAHDHMLSYGLGDWYDIGPGEPGESKLTGRGLTATAIYYVDVTILNQVATLLGRVDDAREYAALAPVVRDAFNHKLFNEGTDQYDHGSQTANAMPLAIGLVPEGHRAAVLKNLVADIRSHENHVTAGDIGFHFVVKALTDGGRSDVLYDMLSRTDSPSYGYQLAKGATTLTEAWDTNPHSSQNHFMLGHAEEWFYRGLAGVVFDLSLPPAQQIQIRPTPVGDVGAAEARYDSVLGTIVSQWKRDAGKFALDVSIPAGAVAMLYLPSGNISSITESGVPLGQASHVRIGRAEVGRTICSVGSGIYHFEFPNQF